MQATRGSGGFSETRIEKFYSFSRDLLDYQVPPDQISDLTADARKLIANFRTKYQLMASRSHSLNVTFYYAANTTVSPQRNSKVFSRFKRVDRLVKSQLTNATVNLELWNCTTLIKKVRQQPEKRFSLGVTGYFSTPNEDVVCLSRLADFYTFIKSKNGGLRTGMFEPNVRDYQGKRNPVNRDIKKTLEESPVKEFWWLNNGITILASEAVIAGNTLSVSNPEIVNGLQTSYEIFTFFNQKPERLKRDARNIVLRVIIPPDEKASGLITKATNFQTEVKGISLHATEEIHFDIEDKLLAKGLFYDRKKGKYKTLQKPVDKIVSVVELARAVIAILLRRPDNARGRPQTLLSNDDAYLKIFDRKYNTDVYVACITLDRTISSFLETYNKATGEEKRDIRYYLEMWLACEMANSPEPSAEQIASLVPNFEGVSKNEIGKPLRKVLSRYRKLGGTEQVSKGSELTRSLQKSLKRRLPVV